VRARDPAAGAQAKANVRSLESMLRRCGASGPTELRHEVKGIAAINAGEILCIELAACEALELIGSGPEGKIGAKEDLFR
jgi:hypothetical protein